MKRAFGWLELGVRSLIIGRGQTWRLALRSFTRGLIQSVGFSRQLIYFFDSSNVIDYNAVAGIFYEHNCCMFGKSLNFMFILGGGYGMV